MKSHYQTLGLDDNASKEDVDRAYRKFAKLYHPDRNLGDPEAERKFKEVTRAHEAILKGDEGESFGNFGNPFDIFGDIFGRATTQQQNLVKQITIDFFEAVSGCQKNININRRDLCESCNGTGGENSRTKSCDICNGMGSITQSKGVFRLQTTCPKCHGKRNVPETDCEKCNGSGQHENTVTVQIDLPTGTRNGERLCMRGQGGLGGDLYVVVNVKEHKCFKRDNDDLYYELPIFYRQAVCGDTMTVPTLDGDVELTIPENTKTGQVFRVKGKGFTNPANKNKGDCLVRVVIDTQVSDEKGYKTLMKGMKDYERETPDMKSFRENTTTGI